ncbi:hypothetical protein NCPPB940_35950 [Xanthomonas hortorum pv. taraxaci]|nr:hypothetical protein NCPPB940_35950 [Xanthomonas hortorum pv. taraxaci]CAD0350547.1 hypothetical protein NCPPB940_35950 [Xanthomonas hortorum pv. taraxaci]
MSCAVAQACSAASNSGSCGGGGPCGSPGSSRFPGLSRPGPPGGCGGSTTPLLVRQRPKAARSSGRSALSSCRPAPGGDGRRAPCSCAQACIAASSAALGGGGGGCGGPPGAPQRLAQPPRLSAASSAVVRAKVGRVWTIVISLDGWRTCASCRHVAGRAMPAFRPAKPCMRVCRACVARVSPDAKRRRAPACAGAAADLRWSWRMHAASALSAGLGERPGDRAVPNESGWRLSSRRRPVPR